MLGGPCPRQQPGHPADLSVWPRQAAAGQVPSCARRVQLPTRWVRSARGRGTGLHLGKLAPAVEHEKEALARAGLAPLGRPLLRVLRQRAVAARALLPLPLLQAQLPQLLHPPPGQLTASGNRAASTGQGDSHWTGSPGKGSEQRCLQGHEPCAAQLLPPLDRHLHTCVDHTRTHTWHAVGFRRAVARTHSSRHAAARSLLRRSIVQSPSWPGPLTFMCSVRCCRIWCGNSGMGWMQMAGLSLAAASSRLPADALPAPAFAPAAPGLSNPHPYLRTVRKHCAWRGPTWGRGKAAVSNPAQADCLMCSLLAASSLWKCKIGALDKPPAARQTLASKHGCHLQEASQLGPLLTVC